MAEIIDRLVPFWTVTQAYHQARTEELRQAVKEGRMAMLMEITNDQLIRSRLARYLYTPTNTNRGPA